jgi:hypothetical protein
MWANYSGKLDYAETKKGSRSSGVGQNIREWWVGEKNCVSNGNSIELQWLVDLMERDKKE